jgi:signal transduction histidine kinase
VIPGPWRKVDSLAALCGIAFIGLVSVAAVVLAPAAAWSDRTDRMPILLLLLISLLLVVITHLAGTVARSYLLAIRITLLIFTGVHYLHRDVFVLALHLLPAWFDTFYFMTGRRRVVFACFLTAGFGYSMVEYYVLGKARFDLGVPGLIGMLLGSLAGSVLGALLARLSRVQQDLRDENDHLKATVAYMASSSSRYLSFASHTERKAREKERLLITRELHDVIGYSLTNTIALMDNAMLNPPGDGPALKALFGLVRNTSARGLSEVRSIVYRLRSLGDRVEGLGAITNLVRTFQESTGVKVNVNYRNCPNDLGSRLNAIVVRVIQESLVNSFRHGKATLIDIYFWLDDHWLQLVIRDNGRVEEVGEKGVGQKGMEERVKRIGGSIRFESMRDGYGVFAMLPVAARRL